jgi:hypothetical protein
MSKNYLLGLNTRNIGTTGRTSTSVMLGSLYGGKGSVSRIYNWCSRTSSDPLNCVFGNGNGKSQNEPDKSSWTNIDVSQLDLGIITGNIGKNGEVIIAGSNGGKIQLSEDLGKTWNSYPGSPELPSLSSGINVVSWSSVVMSDNTNYVIGIPYVPTNANTNKDKNKIYYTANGGSSWNEVTSCNLFGGGTLFFNNTSWNDTLLFIDAGISQDGQYMAVLTTPRQGSSLPVYLISSNDSGTTWTAYPLYPTADPYVVTTIATSISISNTNGNDYFLITSDYDPSSGNNGTCGVSNDGGQTFTIPGNISGNSFVYSSISDDAQYQTFVTSVNTSASSPIKSRLYLSRDYGSNFNKLAELSYTDDNNYLYFGGVSMSANGNYITASVSEVKNGITIFKYIYISSDNGYTWNKIYNDSSGTPFITDKNKAGELGFLNTNFSGKYQMLSGINNILYINNNYGK